MMFFGQCYRVEVATLDPTHWLYRRHVNTARVIRLHWRNDAVARARG